MTKFIECDYCGQRNPIESLCCEFCGAPVIMTELKVRNSYFLPESTPFFQVACSSSIMGGYPLTELCTTASPNDVYVYEDYDLDDPPEEAPSPPKRGWRERLGIGDG